MMVPPSCDATEAPLVAAHATAAARRRPTRRPTPFAEARAAEAEAADEVVALAILDLETDTGEARMSPLAVRLGVTPSTAIKSVRRLERRGLVTHLPYRPIVLTPRGAAVARRAGRRFGIVRDLLVAAGVDQRTAASDAIAIGHRLSEAALTALQRLTPGRL